MRRTGKLGQAAGDNEVRYPIFLENFVSELGHDLSNTEPTTVSEPRNRTRTVNFVSTTLHRRHSLPSVWNPQVYHNEIDNQRSNLQANSQETIAIFIPRVGLASDPNDIRNNHMQDDDAEGATPHHNVGSQCNNNMPVGHRLTRTQHYHVKFAEREHAIERLHHGIKKLPHSKGDLNNDLQITNDPPITKLEFNSLESCFTERNLDVSQKKVPVKSLAYRKARIICLTGSLIALFLILLETCFLFGSLLLRKNCKQLATLFIKVSTIIILLIILEWLRSFLWRGKFQNFNRYNSSKSDTPPDMVLSVPDPPGAPNNFGLGEDQNAAGNFDHSDFNVTGTPIMHNFPMRSTVNRSRFLDGKQMGLSCLILMFYLITFGLLIDGSLWIPGEHTKFINKLPLQNDDQSITPIGNRTNLGTTIKGHKCSVAELYTGAVYLALHSILFVIRIVIFCIRGLGGAVYFCLLRCRRRQMQQELIEKAIIEVALPTLHDNCTFSTERKHKSSEV